MRPQAIAEIFFIGSYNLNSNSRKAKYSYNSLYITVAWTGYPLSSLWRYMTSLISN